MPFDFGNANNEQRQAISTVDGPLLITAGPGTGKTFTLVQRAIYLIKEKGVKPEEIMMVTFTEKAASELVTRITSAMADTGIVVNVQDMWIGTFHSLCMRMLKDNLDRTRLSKHCRVLDQFDQCYTVFQNMKRFNGEAESEAEELLFSNSERYHSKWEIAETICEIVNNLSEELVDPSELLSDSNSDIVEIGKLYRAYLALLKDENLMDFSSIQVECYKLLNNHPDVLNDLRSHIRYIMVDEYQDTNYIQEQLVFMLAGKQKNLCVVGDDDQGLYRFRGATIRNILEFAKKFPDGECKVVTLDVNYRSDKDIVDFYNDWMKSTETPKFSFKWDGFRLSKTIRPHKEKQIKSPAVLKLSSGSAVEDWCEKVLVFINQLHNSGSVKDLNQIAFLFKSVKNSKAVALSRYLEAHGIKVYSPRSAQFFHRDEIMTSIGCLLLLFPSYVQALEDGKYGFLSEEYVQFLMTCAEKANQAAADDNRLMKWIRARGKTHAALTGTSTTDDNFSTLLYQMFAFEPFKGILDTDLKTGVFDSRPVRNLAMLTKLIGKYEYLHNVDIITAKNLISATEQLFNTYLRMLVKDGIPEYEDDSEYAPSGCVSFLTIHQSKGMEFPIVFVDSMYSRPEEQKKKAIMADIEARFFKRDEYEPRKMVKYFDFWRLFYTAFSRAQDMLVLTTPVVEKGSWPSPSAAFINVYNKLPDVDCDMLDLSEFKFHKVKDVFLKDKYSFTSHINVYETCALQYKFYKDLEFEPQRGSGMIFGRLVHETIEDIHKAAIRGEAEKITPDNIAVWFEANYNTLVKMERMYLAPIPRQSALEHVLRYAEAQAGRWHEVVDAEVDVSLIQPDYIIEGKIDLIKGEGDTVEIVDFKTENKPDVNSGDARLEHYKRQLYLYAHLVEQRTGRKVSKMNLYYTSEKDGNPMIAVRNSPTAVEGTVRAFDDTVQKIMRRDYSHTAEAQKTCRGCDFRYYCDKV